MLALPLIVFLLSTFIAPIALLLARSVQNHEVPDSMPALSRALDAWDGHGVPDEHTFALLASGIKDAQQSGQLGTVAKRMNFAQPAFRSLLMKTARGIRSDTPPAWKPALIEIDLRHGAC
jgi:putative spermidine/putrescine transport system permease protein